MNETEEFKAYVWIDASKKKPSDGQQVWASFTFPDGSVCQSYAIWDDSGSDWFMDILSCDLISRVSAIKNGFTVAEITHWMPLPKPPKDN